MSHELLKENLSAYIDGELASSELRELEEHLGACGECRAELESLKAASARFREAAASRSPGNLADSVLAREKASRHLPPLAAKLRFAAALLVITAVLAAAGRMFKPQLSGIFNQVMGMISGAASTVGGK